MTDTTQTGKTPPLGRLAWGAVLAGALILILSSSLIIHPQNHWGIMTTFGRVQTVFKEPGLRFKAPYPFQEYIAVPRHYRVYAPPALEVFLPDEKDVMKNLLVGYYVVWTVEDPVAFYEIFREDAFAEQRMGEALRSHLFNTLSQYPLSAFLSTEEETLRSREISQDLTASVSREFRKDYGLLIDRVALKRVSLPPQNRQKIYERMTAERNRMADRYRAEGEKKAKKITSQADRDKKILLSQAEVEAEKLVAQAEAEAAAIYSQAYRADPDFYRFWRTLEAYKRMFDQDSTFVFTGKSEFFRLLEKQEGLQP